MIEQCNCNYCQLNITEEDQEDLAFDFTTAVIRLFIQQSRGILNTPCNEETIRYSAELQQDLVGGVSADKYTERNRKMFINELALCYEHPVDFYDAMCGLSHLIPCVENALMADRTTASTPILSKIITPEIFLDYYIKREFPEAVRSLINKIEHADFITLTKQ